LINEALRLHLWWWLECIIILKAVSLASSFHLIKRGWVWKEALCDGASLKKRLLINWLLHLLGLLHC